MTVLSQTIAYCLPSDQCSTNDDCILGYICETVDGGLYTWNYCTAPITNCTQDTDCIDGLSCYVPESTCYLACSRDSDCGDDNFYCANVEDGINACVANGVLNGSRTTTEAPDTTDSDTDPIDSLDQCFIDDDCTDGTCVEGTFNNNGISTTFKYCQYTIPDGVITCDADADCLAGWTCSSVGTGYSSCINTAGSTVCNSDDDCGDSELTCSGDDMTAGVCYFGCETADDCGDGYICDGDEYKTCYVDGTVTTEEPGNPSGVEQLVAFIGMFIVAAAGLFM